MVSFPESVTSSPTEDTRCLTYLVGTGRRNDSWRRRWSTAAAPGLHQSNHQIKLNTEEERAARSGVHLRRGYRDVVDAAERFRCRPLLRLERGSGGAGADGGRRQRQRRTSNSLAIAPPLEEKLQRAEFPPHSPRLCAQENPDDFDSGPLYLLTQAVKGNEQVRGRCSSLLRAPARREAAGPCRRSRTRRPRSAGADQLPEQQEAALPRQGLRPPLQHGAPRRRPPRSPRLSTQPEPRLNAAAWRVQVLENVKEMWTETPKVRPPPALPAARR